MAVRRRKMFEVITYSRGVQRYSYYMAYGPDEIVEHLTQRGLGDSDGNSITPIYGGYRSAILESGDFFHI